MNEKYAEKISMLMDDELYDAEAAKVTEGIEHDPDLRHCWERYHLISDALKNNLPALIAHDLADRMSLALKSEPVFALPARRPARVSGSGLRPVIGLALAASVAAVTFVLAPWESSTLSPAVPPIMPQAPLAAVALEPAAATAQVASVAAIPAAATVAVVAGAKTELQEMKVEPRLYNYLVDHNEFSDVSSVQSTMLPYVRIVGYNPHHVQRSH